MKPLQTASRRTRCLSRRCRTDQLKEVWNSGAPVYLLLRFPSTVMMHFFDVPLFRINHSCPISLVNPVKMNNLDWSKTGCGQTVGVIWSWEKGEPCFSLPCGTLFHLSWQDKSHTHSIIVFRIFPHILSVSVKAANVLMSEIPQMVSHC